MLVVRSPQMDISAGLIVDGVRGLTRLSRAEIGQPAGPVEDSVADYLSGVCEHNERLLNILDLQRLLGSADVQQMVSS
jgi:chemotaxis signal transduction protein